MSDRLSANFTRAELACKCGCGGIPPADFIEALQQLREAYGKPMPINSGYRCPEHNAKVSSTGLTGPHTKGAVDVGLTGKEALELLRIASERGWTGVGVRQHGAYGGRFLHLDRLPQAEGQPRPHLWSYP
jgi:uncharacterized protein YcbK (DUF882 family)